MKGIASILLLAAAAPQDDRALLVADLLATLDESGRATAKDRAAAVRALDWMGVHPLDGAPDSRPAAVPYRGRVLGPGYKRGWLEPGGETRTEQQFMAGQRATIGVAAAPTAPVMLTVGQPGEPAVCRDKVRSCRWMPLYTGRYAIVLKNAGAARVRYYLVVD